MTKDQIKAGDAVLLDVDIVRRHQSKLKKYGSRNELVKVVSRSGDTLIVEATEKFSVNIKDVRTN